jgi:hypothetical protein
VILPQNISLSTFHIPLSTKANEMSEDEETENCGVGGEGDSSRAHSIPHGNLNYELHGTWTVLNPSPNPLSRGVGIEGCD